MSKKLTITVSNQVYEDLHRHIGRRKISRFLDALAREHLPDQNFPEFWLHASKRELAAAYEEQAAFEALQGKKIG
jgi:hypothetical protein